MFPETVSLHQLTLLRLFWSPWRLGVVVIAMLLPMTLTGVSPGLEVRTAT